MTTADRPWFERIRARHVAAAIPAGPHSVFARHVALVDPDSVAYWNLGTREWAVGGPLCSRLEVPEVWAGVTTAAAMARLAPALRQDGLSCSIAAVDVVDLGDQLPHSVDLHFVRAAARPAPLSSFTVRDLSIGDFTADCMHPEIRALLGSPASLLQDFGDLSQFHGCSVDGVIVAVADTVVRCDGYTAIQQVFTAGPFRRRGVARALVKRVADTIAKRAETAVYVCAQDNVASARTAIGAGFHLAARLCNVPLG